MSPTGSFCVWSPGSQQVALLGEVVGPEGGAAWLQQVVTGVSPTSVLVLCSLI